MVPQESDGATVGKTNLTLAFVEKKNLQNQQVKFNQT
jgi:hypothetical protein